MKSGAITRQGGEESKRGGGLWGKYGRSGGNQD